MPVIARAEEALLAAYRPPACPQALEVARPAARVAMGSPEVARAFGDISAVPALFLFDRTGCTAGAFYGAPPELHAQAEAKVAALLARPAAER